MYPGKMGFIHDIVPGFLWANSNPNRGLQMPFVIVLYDEWARGFIKRMLTVDVKPCTDAKEVESRAFPQEPITCYKPIRSLTVLDAWISCHLATYRFGQ